MLERLYYGDCVAGTCISLTPFFFFSFSGAVVGNAYIFRRLFQKLTGCKESGVFSDMFINFTGLLEVS